MIEYLAEAGRITENIAADIKQYIKDNQMDTTGKLKTSGIIIHCMFEVHLFITGSILRNYGTCVGEATKHIFPMSCFPMYKRI